MGCSNSKVVLPLPSRDIAQLLERAGLAHNDEAQRALVRGGCTMEVFRELHDDGTLAAALEEFRLGIAVTARLRGAIGGPRGGEGPGRGGGGGCSRRPASEDTRDRRRR